MAPLMFPSLIPGLTLPTLHASEGDEDGGYEPGSPPTSVILLAILVFAFFSLAFTIVAGWVWCVSAAEPAYGPFRPPQRRRRCFGISRFRKWYRRRFNPPPSSGFPKSEGGEGGGDGDGRVSNITSSDNGGRWPRPQAATTFWRIHSLRDVNGASVPLGRMVEGKGYGTITEEFARNGGETCGLVGYSPLTVAGFFNKQQVWLAAHGGGGLEEKVRKGRRSRPWCSRRERRPRKSRRYLIDTGCRKGNNRPGDGGYLEIVMEEA